MAKLFKKPRRSTVIFYTVALLVIVCFYFYMSGLMGKLKTHLDKYQSSHINTQYRLVFEDRFSDPDWGALYEEAGLQGTEFEDKQAFITYMEEKVGDQELICFLESNGTSGKKCPVYLGDEEIGAFYMVSQTDPEPEADPWYYRIPFAKSLVNKLKIQHWEYAYLELKAPNREQSVTVTTEGERIVYVNGVALTDAQLISTTVTTAEQYIPQGLHGMRRQTYSMDGFLVKPVVTVTDLSGNPIEIAEEFPGKYTEVFVPQQAEAELEAYAISAAKTYCNYMIRNTTRAKLQEYFDTSTQLYRNITSIDPWMQNYIGCRFAEPVVSGFYRYSDDLVTVRITMSMFVKRTDYTEKEYPLDSTFFLKKTDSGQYKVWDMNNMDLQQTTTQVRLRFFVDGQMVDSRMVDAAASQIELPAVTAPEGKTFTGWYQATTAADGSQTLSLVFLPKDGEITVYIPDSADISAMDLQARFE